MVEGSNVPGFVWPAVMVVCGGRMAGPFGVRDVNKDLDGVALLPEQGRARDGRALSLRAVWRGSRHP